MKHILFFIALFVCSNATAQRDRTDSSYVKWDAGAWYRVTVTKYDNNESDITQRFIGDTATLLNQFTEKVEQGTGTRANDIAVVSEYPKSNREIIRENDELIAKAGKSPLDTLEDKYSEQFLVPGWTIKTDAGTFNIVFNKTNAKKLRYQYNGTTTQKQTDLFSNSLIRLRDFPATGVTTDFYRSPNGKRWIDATKTNQLIPPRRHGQQVTARKTVN